jgi:predicted ATPase
MRKIVISGGPHTGKTSLINVLREKYPEYNYTPEPASSVLEEFAIQEGNYWRDIFDSPLRFCTACMWKSLQLEKAISLEREISFQDRSLVDTIAYSRRDNCAELVPIVKSLAENALYDMVLFCEPVGEMSDRIETDREAQVTHQLLRNAYEEMNIPIMSIPAISLDDRVQLIERKLLLGSDK